MSFWCMFRLRPGLLIFQEMKQQLQQLFKSQSVAQKWYIIEPEACTFKFYQKARPFDIKEF